VHIFPDQGPGGYPGTNFGNACGAATYKNGADSTALLSDCPSINPGIKTCQAAGKKVLLSLGGGFPHNGYLKSQQTAEAFSDFLWGAFGPQEDTWVTAGKPRPFGDACVDGFDFDIESFGFAPTPTDSNGNTLLNPESFGYNFMVDRLRTLYAGGPFYISAAPQCIIPDSHLSDAIASSHFDFLFVQLYNTPQCSARAAIAGTANPTLATWDQTITDGKSFNPDVKVYLGLVSLLSEFSSHGAALTHQ
jgi:chitinase